MIAWLCMFCNQETSSQTLQQQKDIVSFTWTLVSTNWWCSARVIYSNMKPVLSQRSSRALIYCVHWWKHGNASLTISLMNSLRLSSFSCLRRCWGFPRWSSTFADKHVDKHIPYFWGYACLCWRSTEQLAPTASSTAKGRYFWSRFFRLGSRTPRSSMRWTGHRLFQITSWSQGIRCIKRMLPTCWSQ